MIKFDTQLQAVAFLLAQEPQPVGYWAVVGIADNGASVSPEGDYCVDLKLIVDEAQVGVISVITDEQGAVLRVLAEQRKGA